MAAGVWNNCGRPTRGVVRVNNLSPSKASMLRNVTKGRIVWHDGKEKENKNS